MKFLRILVGINREKLDEHIFVRDVLFGKVHLLKYTAFRRDFGETGDAIRWPVCKSFVISEIRVRA